MGIFDWLFKKKIQHLIQDNGVCETYYDDGTITSRFNLSNGLLDGKYEDYYTGGKVNLTINFKKGKLHGECSKYSISRNHYEYIENFKDGILISQQQIQRIEGTGYGSNTNYKLGPIIDNESNLKNNESLIKKLDLEPEYGVISHLRKKGVNFKLLSD
tara:strand:- start:1022 stop:1495 length:474 start_codon:yes stop_codon:yes gene_type:complete